MINYPVKWRRSSDYLAPNSHQNVDDLCDISDIKWVP